MCDFYHYLPVDDSIMNWGLYSTGVGRGILPPGKKYPPAGHPNLYDFSYERGRVLPEFQILLVTDGMGVFESKITGPKLIKPNTLIFLFPDVWHRYKPDYETGWKERWISINGTIPHYLLEQGIMNPNNAVMHLPEPEHLISVFDQTLDRIHCNPTENTLLTSLNIMALLSDVLAMNQTQMTKPTEPLINNRKYTKDPIVNSILNIIWTQSHRPISVDSILEQVPTSRRTMHRRFKKAHGHSIHDEIIQCRLSRAKRLLRETHIPIKTVAYLSGFSCSERMRRAFEKTIKQSPSEFREQYSPTRTVQKFIPY